jgi:hypothetical protein
MRIATNDKGWDLLALIWGLEEVEGWRGGLDLFCVDVGWVRREVVGLCWWDLLWFGCFGFICEMGLRLIDLWQDYCLWKLG